MTENGPDLAAFIAAHSKPYDPETDDYRRPPFAQPIKAGKNTPIYNAHSYHTKVPPQGIVPYIEHYTDPGDLVLDPFCGSGMIGVAALMCGRHAILSDLSPAAVHIACNYTTPVDVAALKREFGRIREAVREEFAWLYGTTCDRCGGPATIQYTIWSDVFECGRCGGEIVLWEVAVDKESGKVSERFACPACQGQWRKTDLRWLRSQPVVTNYECHGSCRPKRAEHAVTAAELARLAEIEARDIPYWYPTTPFREEEREMWRGVHRDQGITDASKFFTKRNLWALARLWHEAKLCGTERLATAFMFSLTAITNYINKRQSFGGGGGGGVSGTLYVPSVVMEKNVGAVAFRKMQKVMEMTASLIASVSVEAAVSINSAATLPSSLTEKVDYVFTDPPFGSNIFYADCNFLWEAWLNEGFTDESQEAVVHVKLKGKNTLPDYERLMAGSFHEMHRVLKPGRWASVVFHNSDDRIWQAILRAAEQAGFELSEINAFDKEQLSFKGIRGEKGLERVTNKDIVLNLRKPKPGETRSANGKLYPDQAEQRIVEAIAAFLQTGPAPEERTLQGLWNRALEPMLRAGQVSVSMAEVGALLPHYFKEVDGRWYLRGEAVLEGGVFDLKSDAGAIRWLASVLGAEGKPIGELIPLWQQQTAILGGGGDTARLERLLGQNVWHDQRRGRWRLPTAAERERMSARQSLADEAFLRTARRYLKGELSRRPSDLELSEWARHCYKIKAYTEAVALFDKIATPEKLDPARYRDLKKMVAVSRQNAARG